MSALRRRSGPEGHQEVRVDGVVPVMDDAFGKKFPTLLEFLSRVEWEPGQPRQKGTLFLFIEHGMFKVCVSDKDADLIAFVTAPTLQGVLESAEKGLVKDSLDWRPSTQGKARRSR